MSAIRARDGPRWSAMVRVERREGQKREDEKSGGVGAQGLLLAIYGPARSRTRKTRGVRERTVRNPAIYREERTNARRGDGEAR
ncbi:hypothetical protein EAG_07939 [Camponotus floridanus]|uniref:Uncharacterized protein n=1 Tax=Camponotus floridanus TaxID=104421 RepID=E1ZXF4_CAMFO|nr:hypothetical protein EAG_07939 [Camponotus floridanus]